MAITDTLSGEILAVINTSIATTEGNLTGNNQLAHKVHKSITDGTTANKATGFCGTTLTVTTGGITISLADSADPFGAAGDDTPTEDPEGKKLKAILIQNLDATNYIDVGLGTNALTSWLTGTTPAIRVPAGGFILSTMPAGLDAMNDGSDDEIKLTADTASVSVKISYIFG